MESGSSDFIFPIKNLEIKVCTLSLIKLITFKNRENPNVQDIYCTKSDPENPHQPFSLPTFIDKIISTDSPPLSVLVGENP